MASLRVCTITFDWYPFEVRALRMAEAAADAGYDVDVICLRKRGESRHEVIHGVHVYRLPVKRIAHTLPLKILYWCWFALLAEVVVTWFHLNRSYNVVHVHNMPDFLVFAALFPRLLGAKIVLDIQDVSPELMAAKASGLKRLITMRLATWQEHISTSFAHHVVTTGKPFETILVQRGVPREKITNILNSADTHLFPAARKCPPPFDVAQDKDKQPFILMYHGTLCERNGLDIALHALVLARRVVPQLRLDIQGGGDQLAYLKQLTRELGLSDSVIFTDSVDSAKLADFVVHGDVGIIPYRCDGFANLVLPTKAYEFAWMGRPMIASNTFAIRSMFRPESIVLCDPAKPETFAEAIIDLYQHPEKRVRMIANAAEDYMPYRWELAAERYQQLLARLSYAPVKEEHAQEQPLINSGL